MSFLENSLKVLLEVTAAFFVIFWYLCLSWSGRRKTDPRNIFASAVVSFLYTFKIVLVVFLVVFIASFFIDKPLS